MSTPVPDVRWASTASPRHGHLALPGDVEPRRTTIHHHAAEEPQGAARDQE
ncbi:hypothetical protein [Streptomyces hygroscopicus]|uniref:hypothetical protein n=1 Tax=Streptomyces hygroscopicus TaxID=1912 RepID=UPI000A758AD5|nr:hypothetical protein [Streptomyces hygroscopicus]MBW8088655.1 hypothetical protein [Streptomyces hygroscopicus subsp. hygroscopicus]